MHKIRTTINISLCWLLLCFACNPEEKVNLQKNEYFDLKGLIAEQINLLDSLNPTIQKEAIIDGEAEVKTLQFDSAAWARELDLFIQADINKPNLRGSFEVNEEGMAEQGAKATTYTAKDKKDIGIEYLKVFRKDGNLERVETLYTETNALYNTFRKLELFFEPAGNKARLTAYSVDGRQKMVLKDTVFYTISAEIQY